METSPTQLSEINVYFVPVPSKRLMAIKIIRNLRHLSTKHMFRQWWTGKRVLKLNGRPQWRSPSCVWRGPSRRSERGVDLLLPCRADVAVLISVGVSYSFSSLIARNGRAINWGWGETNLFGRSTAALFLIYLIYMEIFLVSTAKTMLRYIILEREWGINIFELLEMPWRWGWRWRVY